MSGLLIGLVVGAAGGYLYGARKGKAALATAKKVWNAILEKERGLVGR